MKPLPVSKDVSVYLPAVRLYRDDLERILAHMDEAELRTTINDDTFEYDSLDELKKARGSYVRNVNIAGLNRDQTRYRTVTLSTWHNQWHLSSYGDAYEVARDIEVILRARQSLVERVPHLWMIIIGGPIGGSSTVLNRISPSVAPIVLTLGVGLMLLGAILAAYSKLRHGIILTYRHEAGFFSRNRDKIIVAVCTALFLAGLQLIIWLLTGHNIKLFGP